VLDGRSRGGSRGCALVTGASRGIGAAIARGLAADGWPVGVNYRVDESGAAATVATIEADGGHAVAVQADVADAVAVDAMFEELDQSLGPVLVLVNNAGTRADQLFAAIGDDEWVPTLDTNLTGAYRTMRRALRGMSRARFGRIVNVTSIIGHRPLPGLSAYATSKAALEGLTRNVAIEVARRGVTVNAVAPGVVDTELTSDIQELKDTATSSTIPARRAGTPEDVAACVRFLASEPAGYVTGSTLVVDGGLSACLFPLPRTTTSDAAPAEAAANGAPAPTPSRR
jgi:3-oxoacyl-[acyl-carrier protein] reductase